MGGSAGTLRDALGDPQNKRSLRQSFEKYDKDRNGFLNKEEFEAFVDDIDSIAKAHRYTIYVGGARQLSSLGGTPIKRAKDKAWQELDTNRDGKISLEEFEKWVSEAGRLMQGVLS